MTGFLVGHQRTSFMCGIYGIVSHSLDKEEILARLRDGTDSETSGT